MAKFEIGDKVLKSGYEGVIVSEYMPGMYEVRLDSGIVVVPGEELKAPMQIKIFNREYQIEIEENGDGNGLDRYYLVGARGARYRTWRNQNNQHLMFLVNARDWTKSVPDVFLTDKNGKLELTGII